MEMNLDLINSLTAEDTKVILKLDELRKEAEEAHKIIKDNVKFSIGEDKKIVWKDEHNAEYITNEGVWQARYLHKTYDVICTIENIFNVFKERYLYDINGNKCRVNNIADSAGYFRSFVSKLEKESKNKSE